MKLEQFLTYLAIVESVCAISYLCVDAVFALC